MKMGDFWTRTQPIRRQGQKWEIFGQEPDQLEGKYKNGRLVDKSQTNKKVGMKMWDLWTKARPIRRQG